MPTVVSTPRTVPRSPAPPAPGVDRESLPARCAPPAAPQRHRLHRRGPTRPGPALRPHPTGSRRSHRASPTAAPATPPTARRTRTWTGPPGRTRRPRRPQPPDAAPPRTPAPTRHRWPALRGSGRRARRAASVRRRLPGPPPRRTSARHRRILRSRRRTARGRWSAAAQAGDMTAFGELFDRYYDIVFRYVLFRMGDRTLAEDVTQETFVRALRRISSVSYQGRDIGAWFVTIARNLIFDHVKSSRYRLEPTTSTSSSCRPARTAPSSRCSTGRPTRSCCAASASSTRTSRNASRCGSCRACRSPRPPDHGPQRGRGQGPAAPRGPPARPAAAGGPAMTAASRVAICIVPEDPSVTGAANERLDAVNGLRP